MSEKKYNTVTLPQIFWKILSRWWIVVICIVIGGVALYKYASRDYDAKLKAYEADNTAYEAKLTEYNELFEFNTAYRAVSNGTKEEKAKKAEEMAKFSKARISSDQMVMINDALELKEQMKQVANIKDELITARVNPYKIPTLSMVFMVIAETPSEQTNLNVYYQAAHDSQRIWTDLYKMLGYTEEEYSQFTGCNTFSVTKEGRVLLTLYYDDLDGLKKVRDSLEKVMNNVYKDILKNSGINHEMKKTDATIYTKSDTTVATQQNTYKQWIVDYNNRLNSLKSTFSQSQNAILSNYYEYLSDKADGGDGYITVKDLTKPLEDENAAPKPRNPKVMAVIGALAGLVLGIAIIVFIMLFAGRLQKAEDLSELFSLGLIGTLLSNGFTLPFEKLVKYLSTRRYGAFSVEKKIKMTAAKLKIMCESKGIKSIVLSGTASGNNPKLLDRFKAELDALGIKTEASGDILKDTEVLKKAAETGNIIFVEKEIKTAYADVEREILIAKDCNIDILGSIYIY